MNNRKYPDILTDKVAGRESGYYNTSIMIEGLYGYGCGFYSFAKRTDFYTEVYPALIRRGYRFERSELYGGCDHLHKDGSRINLYMHPTKFSGPATQEQAKEIAEILDLCDCIDRVSIEYSGILYDLSDMEYRDIFLDEAAKLAEYMLQPYDLWDMAKNIAVDRIQKPYCGLLGSSDINYDVFDYIGKQINELRSDGVSDSEIPDIVQQRANGIKKEIHRLDDLFTEAAGKLSIADKLSFFKCEYIEENEFEEHMKKYGLKTIGQYRDIAEWNSIPTSLSDHEEPRQPEDESEEMTMEGP